MWHLRCTSAFIHDAHLMTVGTCQSIFACDCADAVIGVHECVLSTSSDVRHCLSHHLALLARELQLGPNTRVFITGLCFYR